MVRKYLQKSFEKFAPKGYSVTQAPYPVISYKDAMLKYGTDKPDLRNPLEIVDVTEIFPALHIQAVPRTDSKSHQGS